MFAATATTAAPSTGTPMRQDERARAGRPPSPPHQGNDIAIALGGASPRLDPNGQRLAVNLYRALAEGQPVSVPALARRCGLGEARVAETLAAWPGVSFDETGS